MSRERIFIGFELRSKLLNGVIFFETISSITSITRLNFLGVEDMSNVVENSGVKLAKINATKESFNFEQNLIIFIP
jgi:hypothetical protein